MAIIAKGMITLNSVNDAYSVSLSPSSCVIQADWDGSNPQLDIAKTDIQVFLGDRPVEFEIVDTIYEGVEVYSMVNADPYIKSISIEELSVGVGGGKMRWLIKAGTFQSWATFTFSVVRETSMLDWILDWEGRTKTEIAGEHIITPKIFVGKSENQGELTGTYIGPAFNGSGRVGVFGYSAGNEIFHLDDTGGMIGGWVIEEGRIKTTDGTLTIASNGSISSAPLNKTAWSLNKDGSAIFSKGNVKFNADGEASFVDGLISLGAEKSTISGWEIKPNSLQTSHTALVSNNNESGLYFTRSNFTDSLTHKEAVETEGGIELTCALDSANFSAYVRNSNGTTSRAFHLDTNGNNQIGSWKFTKASLYLGERAENTPGSYTSQSSWVTMGTNGIRGCAWRLESDGSGSLAGGKIQWDTDGTLRLSSAMKILGEDGSTVSLFDNDGRISASLLDIKQVIARNESGRKVGSFNENNDGAHIIYYPNGTIMMRYGYSDQGGIQSVAQHYGEDGKIDWVISPKGTTNQCNWTIVDYLSNDSSGSRSPHRLSPTTLYSLEVTGFSVSNVLCSSPNLDAAFTGHLYSLTCSPTEVDGSERAYRTRRQFANGREISVDYIDCGPWDASLYE